ncbi:hypothetical protein PMI29_02783 [Pseudomonas sp. GM49]|nr:hypothetical protein PMI29_02783 [Pseudomonas sp. GM49]
MLLEDKVVMVSGVGLGIKLALAGACAVRRSAPALRCFWRRTTPVQSMARNSMPTAAMSCTEEEGR